VIVKTGNLNCRADFFALLVLAIGLACGKSGGMSDAQVPVDISTPDGVVPDIETEDGSDFGSDIADVDATSDEGDLTTPPPSWTIVQEQLPSPADFVLRGVTAVPNGSIWAVGQDGVILQRAADGWSINSSGLHPYLHAVDSAGPGDMMAVGRFGTRLRFVDGEWQSGTACEDDAACGDGDACTDDYCVAQQCQHIPLALQGCCGLPAYNENFDGANAESLLEVDDLYALESGKGGLVWQVVSIQDPITGQFRYTSGPNALYFGDPDATCSFSPDPENPMTCPTFDNGQIVGARVTLPSVMIPKSKKVTMIFQLFLDVEPGTFDMLTMSVLAPGMLPMVVWSKENIPGVPGATGGFIPIEVDLSAYSQQLINITFEFDSLDQYGNAGEGVYIDDIEIATECGAPDQLEGDEDAPTFFDVSGTNGNVYFAVGLNGSIWHHDGENGWKDSVAIARADWYAAHYDGSVLLVGGKEGSLIERHGNLFSAPETSTIRTIRDVHVFADGSRIAVGDSGLVLFAGPEGDFVGVSSTPSSVDLLGVDGLNSSDITIVGKSGTIWRFDGSSFVVEPSSVSLELRDVDVRENGSRLAVGEQGTLLEDTGAGWVQIPKVNNDGMNRIFAWDDNNIVVVGDYGTILHKDPVLGTYGKKQSPVSKNMYGVFGFAADDIWAVGLFGTVIRYDGVMWTNVEYEIETDFYGLTGKAPDKLYAVGENGAVVQLGLEVPVYLLSATDNNLRGVFALDEDHVWAVGSFGTIMYGNGAAWAQQFVPSEFMRDGTEIAFEESLFAVWGASANDVWAAGDGGAMIHYEDGVWSKVEREDPHTIRAIEGWAKDAILAVGSVGYAAFYDGENWHNIDTGAIATLHDIHLIDDQTAMVVGDAGTVLLLTRPAPVAVAD
jgi:photosystem II stability/assembly factor-like uncharacterized protein